MARRKVTQHDKEIQGRTNLATTYHTELVDSSKKLLSSDCVAPTTISPRPPGFVCPQTGPVLVTDACRSAHLLAPAPTRLASPPWRMVGAGEGCTARGGARQWRPRRILRLTFSGPAWPSRDRRRSEKWKRRSGKGNWKKWKRKKKKKFPT